MKPDSANPSADAVETIFNAALKFGRTERAAFLAGACGENGQLRQRVEVLLRAQEEAEGFLPDSPQATPTALQPVTEAVGDKIGRYKLLQQIGEGGMGVVYIAEQDEPVRRRVALKIIKLGMDTKQVVARFEAERQALALMDHPNIARVLDGGATETGRPYFVMELVQGVPITEFCDKNKLSAKDRLKLFIQVCQAIQSAHQKGIIHRDIKPSNVLVTLHHGDPMPKVIDFGIAKATNQKLTEKTLFTNYATMIGTPAYMSPEQAEMSSMDVDTRTDVYALGVLLYELLTGTTPFPEKRLRSLGYGEMQRVIMEEEPERPSTRLSTMANEQKTVVAKNRGEELTALSKLLKGDLDWVVMKCLEKDRTRRYETANGVAADIQRHLNNEPVVARPPSVVYRFHKLVRRNKLAFAAAAAVTAALMLGIIISTWEARRAILAKDEARANELQAREARADETKQRSLAEASALTAQQNLYAAHMNLALQAVEEKNIGYALKLLNLHRPQSGQRDMRGWEWRYLWKLCQSEELHKLGSHSNTVCAAVFSPKGDLLATCSDDHTVKLWDMATKRERAVLQHPAPVRVAAFSAGGTQLATACGDGMLRSWDLATHHEIARIPIGKIALVGSPPAFAADGAMIAVGERDGRVNVWDVIKQTNILTLHSERQPNCLAFSRDGKMLAAGYRFEVGLWDLSRRERVLFLTNHTAWATSLAFSFDAKTLAVACEDGAIKLWDLSTRREIRTLSGHTTWLPASVVFSRDDKILASASADHTVIIWDVATGQSRTLQGHLNEVWAIAITPDGRMLATGTKKDGMVALWSTTPKPSERTSQPVRTDSHIYTELVALSPDAGTFLIAYPDNTIGVWETAALKETSNFPLNFTRPARFAISPLGNELIAIGEPDGVIQLKEISPNRENARFSTGGAAVENLAFSCDGKQLAAASADGRIRVWEIAAHRLLTEIEGHTNKVNNGVLGLVFSANGKTLCAGYVDPTAEIFDVATGKRLAFFEGHKNPVCGVVLLPYGKTAATASYDQDVKLWDVKTQKELATLGGETLAHFALALSPDGQRLAANGASGIVRLWDPATRQLVGVFKAGPVGGLRALGFSPDGNTLVSVSNMMLHVWRAPSWAEIEAAEKARPFEQ